MRDVTPVEALDVKLAAIASEERMARMPASNADQFETHLDARLSLDLLRQAVPVAWSVEMFQLVSKAAASYPCDTWPVVPPETSLRLHVCPGNVLDAGDREALPIRVFIAGFVSHGDVQTLTIRGFSYIEEYRFWSPGLFLQVPIRSSIDDVTVNTTRNYGQRISIDRRRRIVAWTFASWAFLDQRIATEERADVLRPARKRAQRIDIDPVVHVVRLRKAEPHTHGDGGAGDREYSCQWLVRGHWRNQWHPRMARHAPVWIAPHIKGPADMPLRTPAPEVWQVAR